MNKFPRFRADRALAALGLVAALPAIYFFTGSFLKYELGLLDGVEIFLFHPSVLIGGPLLSVVLNLFSLLFHFGERGKGGKEQNSHKAIWANLLSLSLAILFLLLLLGYVVVENL